MKQQHSYHRLYYHLVIHTKYRQHFIEKRVDGERLVKYLSVKAIELGSYIEESGFWRDHVHLLLRCTVIYPLSQVYGQMKGFSWAAWRKHFPSRPFRWGDGVYIATVDNEKNRRLREYIRNQWERHEKGDIIEKWEPISN